VPKYSFNLLRRYECQGRFGSFARFTLCLAFVCLANVPNVCRLRISFVRWQKNCYGLQCQPVKVDLLCQSLVFVVSARSEYCRHRLAGNTNRYLRWQDILCSVTPIPKLIKVLLPACRQAEDNICRLIINSRVGKGMAAQASHKTVLEILTSHGFSHSA